MSKIEKLTSLKQKLMLLTYLASLGVGIIGNSEITNASENTEIVKQEETEVNNENNKCETYEEKITYYSNVYGIKEQYVHDYMDYMLNENLDNQEFLNMNLDLQIITAVRTIYNDKSISKEEKLTGKVYNVTLSPEELILKYSPIFENNKTICLTLSCVECKEPIQNDWNYRTNGNPAGIGGDMYLGNAEMGIIYYMDMLHNSYGVTEETGAEFFGRVSKTYCPPNWKQWENMASSIYSQLDNDYFARAPKEVKEKYTYNAETDTYEINEVKNHYSKTLK